MFRTVMEHFNCCAGRDDCSHSSSASLLTVAMPVERWRSWSGAPERGKAIRCQGLPGLAQAMDSGADVCLDQSQPWLARDFERYATTVAAFVRLAMIRIMLRRLAA